MCALAWPARHRSAPCRPRRRRAAEPRGGRGGRLTRSRCPSWVRSVLMYGRQRVLGAVGMACIEVVGGEWRIGVGGRFPLVPPAAVVEACHPPTCSVALGFRALAKSRPRCGLGPCAGRLAPPGKPGGWPGGPEAAGAKNATVPPQPPPLTCGDPPIQLSATRQRFSQPGHASWEGGQGAPLSCPPGRRRDCSISRLQMAVPALHMEGQISTADDASGVPTLLAGQLL